MEQADPYYFYLVQGLKHWLLQKLTMKSLDQKFRFLIKK